MHHFYSVLSAVTPDLQCINYYLISASLSLIGRFGHGGGASLRTIAPGSPMEPEAPATPFSPVGPSNPYSTGKGRENQG